MVDIELTRCKTRNDFEYLSVRALVSDNIYWQWIGVGTIAKWNLGHERSGLQKQQHNPLQNVDDVSHSMIPASAVSSISDISRIRSSKNTKILIDNNMYANRDLIINCSIHNKI